MKLITKKQEQQLIAQYPKGADMDIQKVVVKLFHPLSQYTVYLMNMDPEDKNYCWGICKNGDITEQGSFSIKEIQSIKIMGLGFERDIYFTPLPAAEAYRRLSQNEHL